MSHLNNQVETLLNTKPLSWSGYKYINIYMTRNKYHHSRAILWVLCGHLWATLTATSVAEFSRSRLIFVANLYHFSFFSSLEAWRRSANITTFQQKQTTETTRETPVRQLVDAHVNKPCFHFKLFLLWGSPETSRRLLWQAITVSGWF